MPDAAFVVQNNFDGFARVVRHFDQVKVAGADELVLLLQLRFQPAQQAAPVIAPEQDERKLWDALRLGERNDFEEFVERAEAARHENETEAVFREANLARKEIMEMQRQINESIARLLVGQFNVEADGFAAALPRAFVRRFHGARSAAGDDGEIVLRQAFGNRHGGMIIFVIRAHPRGAENGDGGTGLRKRLEGIHELGHDAKNAPRILADEGS